MSPVNDDTEVSNGLVFAYNNKVKVVQPGDRSEIRFLSPHGPCPIEMNGVRNGGAGGFQL